MVPGIGEELGHPVCPKGPVEYSRLDGLQSLRVGRPQQAYIRLAQRGQSLRIRSVSSAWPVSSATMSSSWTIMPLSPNASAS